MIKCAGNLKMCIRDRDKVKAGDLIAEADLKGLLELQVNPITPVIICGGAEGCGMEARTGGVKAGKDAVVIIMRQDNAKSTQAISKKTDAWEEKSVPDKAVPPEKREKPEKLEKPEKSEKQAKKAKRRSIINFDFLQKLGKVLMTVIAVMPAAGLMISVGKLVQMSGGNMDMVLTIGSTMENIGWAIINNLHILFAVAIGGSWAKEKAGGAFAAVIAFILINVITGALFGVSSACLLYTSRCV